MQTLSAEFDRAMKPASPLTPYVPVRRYRELSCENPDWAWKRVKAHVQEFTAVIYDMPPVPPKTDAAGNYAPQSPGFISCSATHRHPRVKPQLRRRTHD